MFPSSSHPPTLHTTAPTPSTTLFTVSTRSPSHTLLARSLHYLALLLRVIVGIAIIVLFWAKWRQRGGDEAQGLGETAWYEDMVLSSPVGQMAGWAARGLSWTWVVGGTMIGGWAVTRRGYTEESLLVLRGLGIQTSSSSPTYLSTPTTRFIPTTAIQDIFIHEAFKGFEVRFYLAIVVQGEEDVVVVFPTLLPNRHILETVWRGARACLYEPAAAKA
ncbi:hypothetical protein W97_07989 [Coniosporium apollinis CBS 100218]|uniref:Phosphatidylinositol N-acetylglucosaminyltransferase subunit H conserved domain-containing protein n=1 Tax=Coniosporium apollinis (strain CBS 100218) TaxID=1168221 RepID=R7Z486_CONA1|nr:uncharacterized protein W97_07989 [Coniosporium apollinis CBS 100218]EON68731.1 hypothetical protein W97_07989 [Coniosporium apollinis CBS 100218]